MNVAHKFLLLIFLSAAAIAFADNVQLEEGQQVEDFSWPSAHSGEPGQRLLEQRGNPLLLIWTGRCDRCEEQLMQYQALAESHKADGLQAWVIWTPVKEDLPPLLHIPVLTADSYWQTGWQYESRPVVMMIGPQGRLDHLIRGDLKNNYSATKEKLAVWLAAVKRQTP